MADPDTVAAQYATPDRLRRRMSIWRPGPDGRTPRDVARDLVVGLAPRSVLEVGCGTGELAEEIAAALPACAYLATDASESMVAATAARGLHAEVATIGSLPYPDASFDVVVAAWMLYHVPDLDAALAEVRRVLRPGGSFVAVTNSDRHLARLLEDAGGDILVTQFSSENGEEALSIESITADTSPSSRVTPAICRRSFSFPTFSSESMMEKTIPSSCMAQSFFAKRIFSSRLTM